MVREPIRPGSRAPPAPLAPRRSTLGTPLAARWERRRSADTRSRGNLLTIWDWDAPEPAPQHDVVDTLDGTGDHEREAECHGLGRAGQHGPDRAGEVAGRIRDRRRR